MKPPDVVPAAKSEAPVELAPKMGALAGGGTTTGVWGFDSACVLPKRFVPPPVAPLPNALVPVLLPKRMGDEEAAPEPKPKEIPPAGCATLKPEAGGDNVKPVAFAEESPPPPPPPRNAFLAASAPAFFFSSSAFAFSS